MQRIFFLIYVFFSRLVSVMGSGITIQDLLERNKVYAKNHSAFPDLKDVAKMPNFMKIAIVSCVDGRVNPEKFLQLHPGEAFVMKTVAGHPSNIFQDLLVLDTLSTLEKVIIIHHTDCGATHVTDEQIKSKLEGRLPDRKEEIAAMSFGAIKNLEESLTSDVQFLRNHPYIRKELGANTVGLLYDLKTGLVQEVGVDGTGQGRDEL